MGPETLAQACAEAMKLEQPPSSTWPHVQQLGDCLRCTIECPDVQSMLRSWKRLRSVFRLREGRGRMNNRLLSSFTIDMNINVSFSDGPVEMLGEVQIHLAQTHALKQQE